MLASASEEIFTSAFLFSKLRGLITTLIGAPIRSESLNLDSRPEDAKLIYNMLVHDRQIVYDSKDEDMLLNKKDINKLMSKF